MCGDLPTRGDTCISPAQTTMCHAFLNNLTSDSGSEWVRNRKIKVHDKGKVISLVTLLSLGHISHTLLDGLDALSYC